MVEGMARNNDFLIPHGRGWLLRHFRYLNTPSRAGPSRQDIIFKPTNSLTRIDVSAMYSDPPLWLIYQLVVCLWGYVGWKCDAVRKTKSGGGDNSDAWFVDAICGLLQFRSHHCYPRILYIGSTLLFCPLENLVLSILRAMP